MREPTLFEDLDMAMRLAISAMHDSIKLMNENRARLRIIDDMYKEIIVGKVNRMHRTVLNSRERENKRFEKIFKIIEGQQTDPIDNDDIEGD